MRDQVKKIYPIMTGPMYGAIALVVFMIAFMVLYFKTEQGTDFIPATITISTIATFIIMGVAGIITIAKTQRDLRKGVLSVHEGIVWQIDIDDFTNNERVVIANFVNYVSLYNPRNRIEVALRRMNETIHRKTETLFITIEPAGDVGFNRFGVWKRVRGWSKNRKNKIEWLGETQQTISLALHELAHCMMKHSEHVEHLVITRGKIEHLIKVKENG